MSQKETDFVLALPGVKSDAEEITHHLIANDARVAAFFDDVTASLKRLYGEPTLIDVMASMAYALGCVASSATGQMVSCGHTACARSVARAYMASIVAPALSCVLNVIDENPGHIKEPLGTCH